MSYFILAFFLIILDQIVKFWVVEHIALYEHIDFLPPLVDLTYVQNTGAAFSMLSNHTWALTIVSTIISVGVAIALKQKFFSRPFGQFSLSLLLAGAVGNLIDRAFRGFVVDMFNLMFIRFAVFNVADICVVLGGLCCGFYYLFLFEKYDVPPETTPESVPESILEETTPPEDTSTNHPQDLES